MEDTVILSRTVFDVILAGPVVGIIIGCVLTNIFLRRRVPSPKEIKE